MFLVRLTKGEKKERRRGKNVQVNIRKKIENIITDPIDNERLKNNIHIYTMKNVMLTNLIT